MWGLDLAKENALPFDHSNGCVRAINTPYPMEIENETMEQAH